MKSSRQRFAEFREKIKKGLLDKDRLGEKDGRRAEGDTGGRHGHRAFADYKIKRTKRALLSEYRLMLRGYYAPVAVLMSLALFMAVNSLVMPWAVKILIDYIGAGRGLAEYAGTNWAGFLPTTPLGSLYWLGGLLFASALFGVGLDWIRLLAQQRLNFRLAGTLRQRLHNHLQRLSLAQLSDYKTGGIVSRIMSDPDQVVGGVQNALINPFGAALRIGGALMIVIFTDWRLFVAAAATIPPIIIVHFFLFKRLRPLWRNIHDERSVLSGRLTDTYGGIRVVRSFQRERFESKEFGAGQNTMIRKQQFTAILGRLLSTGWGVFVPLMVVVMIFYGGKRVLDTMHLPLEDPNRLTVGKLVMFQTYLLMLLGPITHVIESIQQLQQNLGALDRVVDVLEQTPDMPDKPNALALNNPRGELELVDVHFGYSPDKPVLQGIDLFVPAGATLAIVGPSGSGKTTLVNLIARFFDVNKGAILLDGVDIRDTKLQDYRSLFAMVLQDVYLFDGTVAQNIAYGRRHATREEIIDAARKANAHDFIETLEKGYDTIVGERGSKLSGGQKQRISIARAILANPRILILDEATSSLDSQSEHLIQASLRELMQGRTTFVIAHRLSTIMHADNIVVLVDGKIVEQGSHEQLLEKRGVYHVMFTTQFERHRDPALERIEWEKVG